MDSSFSFTRFNHSRGFSNPSHSLNVSYTSYSLWLVHIPLALLQLLLKPSCFIGSILSSYLPNPSYSPSRSYLTDPRERPLPSS